MKSPCPAPVSAETAPAQPAQPRLIQLGPEHLQACHALDQRALEGLWSETQWAQELKDPRRPCLGLVEQPQQLIGLACGWLVVDELHITAIALDPDYRRQGLGRRLLQALLSHGGEQGAVHATLEVASSNEAAVSLYESCGFRTAGIRRAYYRNGDDALIQWLRLREAE